MSSNIRIPFSSLTIHENQFSEPEVIRQERSSYTHPQTSTTDVTQLTWNGFKKAIAAGGPPTTPLGKFFDWLLNIRDYPKEINPDDIVESPQEAKTSYMRYLLGNGKAEEYQKILDTIGVLFDSKVPKNHQKAQCIVDKLDGIFSDCQDNLTPEISGGSVVPTCSDDHPAKIISTKCLNEEANSTAPLYMEIAPGLYLNHTFSFGNSSTAPVFFDPDAPKTDASWVLCDDVWNFVPVGLGETCRSQLESSFRKHLWHHVQTCISEEDTSPSQMSADVYTKPSKFPNNIVTPFVFDSNPQQDTLNLYYPHVRLEGRTAPMLMAMQWTIRVLPTSEKYQAIQQCIIQTLDRHQTLCYDGMQDALHDAWIDNCTNLNALFYGSLNSYTYGVLGDLAKVPTAVTSLFDEIFLEHRIINSITFAADPTPAPPFFWPHFVLNATTMNSSAYVATITKTFNESFLCSIAHCYPPSVETHERFKSCRLDQSINDNRWILLALGGISFIALITLVRHTKWKNREDRIIYKMPLH